jgi:hypothetical protein
MMRVRMTPDPGTNSPASDDRCRHCGSQKIVRHVRLDQTADAGRIGLPYKARLHIRVVETLFADLCDACGTVQRLYVDHTGRPWVRD